MAFGFFGNTGYGGVPTSADAGLTESRRLDSQDLRGRLGLFNRYLANSPGFGAMTDRGQYIAESQFNPLSAEFALRNANAPGPASQTDFRDFINSTTGGRSPQTRAELLAQIDSSRRLFPAGGLANTADNANEVSARNSLMDDATGGNIVQQAMLSGMNPFLRSRGRNVAQNRMDAFRDQNADMSFYEALLGGNFGSTSA